MELDPGRNSEIKKAFRRFKQTTEYGADESGRVEIAGKRFNIMGSEYFMSDILETLSEIYGAGAGGILRSTGEGYGEDLVEMLDSPDFVEVLGFLASLGYSIPRIEEEAVVFPESPTAVAHSKTDHEEKNVCYFLSGILTSAASKISGEDIEFHEETCRAGEGEECVFTHG